MANIYYEQHGDLTLLKGKRLAIVGYGSQGHAHALNLRDSGMDVMVACYPSSPSAERAKAAGLAVRSVEDATKLADFVMVLIPDQTQKKVYQESIAPRPASRPDVDVRARFQYSLQAGDSSRDRGCVDDRAQRSWSSREGTLCRGCRGSGVVGRPSGCFGTGPQNALAYARALGALKAGVIETTFKEETESDLFGEQSVLCGGVTALIKAAYETLVDAGYQPEIAYFECLHELKLIVDLIYQGGLAYMRYSVSDTAEYGDYSRGPKVVDDHVRATMKKILADIQDGSFAREWIAENETGRQNFNRMRSEDAAHSVEVVGKRLREMMSFLPKTHQTAQTQPNEVLAKAGDRNEAACGGYNGEDVLKFGCVFALLVELL